MRYIKKYNDYFLFEAISIKQIKEQYKDIPNKIFVELIKCDPYTKLVKNPETNKINITNLGKYGISMLNIYNNIVSIQEKDRLLKEDLPKAKQYIELLYKYRNAVKVNYTEIDSMSKLYDTAKLFMLSKENVDVKILLDNLEKDIDYHILLNRQNWYIFKPITEKGACVLGAGTQWCTAWGKDSTNPEYQDRSNHFESHNNQGPLFIIINKKDNSEKYQFHFETNQFKDKYDFEINKERFISDNEDIKKYFFPSLFGLEGDSEKELLRSKLLDNKDITELIKAIYGYENKLAAAFLSEKDEEVLKCYDDYTKEDFESEIEKLDDDEIEFLVKLTGDMVGVESDLSILKDQENYAYDNVWSSVYDEGNDDSYYDDLFDDLFDEYYNSNTNNIISRIGNVSLDKLKDRLFLNFRENEGILETIKDIIVDTSINEYLYDCRKEINDITKYINFECNNYKNYFYNVTIPIGPLLKYILDEEIDTISNTNTFIEEYLSFNQLWGSGDPYISCIYDSSNVNYKNKKLSAQIDEFFESKFDIIEKETDFDEKERERKINIYEDTLKKYFIDDVFNNNNLKIVINKFDKDALLVNVSIFFYKTNKNYHGYISIDQLINYITHEDLFD